MNTTPTANTAISVSGPTFAGLLLPMVLLIVGLALPAHADYDEAESILVSGTIGGTRGLRIRRVGAGAAAFSKNSNFVYYPASSIKVLQHFYAMVLIENGHWTLQGTQAFVCTAGQNCSFLPNVQTVCQAQAEPAEDVLRKMMRNSSNTHTNTVQERVGSSFPLVYPLLQPATRGRVLITDFAQDTLGMNDSGIFHKFGCGGFCGNDSPNQLTLRDIEKLYRGVATDADLLPPAQRVVMKDLMLNEGNSFLDSIIDQEAAATGKNTWKQAFKNKLFKIYKDGSWTCSNKSYRSSSGLIQLPTHNGAHKRLYTWGVFTHDSEAWAYLPGTVQGSVKELLRYPIRSALLTWGFGYAPAESSGNIAKGIKSILPDVGTGAAVNLRLAIDRLTDAQAELANDQRDYGYAVSKLSEAVQLVENARSTEPGEVLFDLAHEIASIGHEVAVDAVALLTMTGDGAELGSAIEAMEAGIRQGEEASAASDPVAAIEGYQSAIGSGAHLIDWSSRGAEAEDKSEGFFGQPIQSTLFTDDFESGLIDWN